MHEITIVNEPLVQYQDENTIPLKIVHKVYSFMTTYNFIEYNMITHDDWVYFFQWMKKNQVIVSKNGTYYTRGQQWNKFFSYIP